MIIEEQNRIFEALRQIDPGIIEDGVSDEAAYTSAPYRILYLLKEVNGGSGWSLCDHLRNGGRPQEHDATWDNVARWTEGIFHLPEELAWSELEEDCKNRRKRMLPQICAVNVKKTSGSYVSDGRKIYEEAQNNANILREQLELYAPDLLICCGTDAAFVNACFPEQRVEWKTTSRGIQYFRDHDRTVIAFSHPAARVKDCYLYYALLDAVREIMNIEERQTILI